MGIFKSTKTEEEKKNSTAKKPVAKDAKTTATKKVSMKDMYETEGKQSAKAVIKSGTAYKSKGMAYRVLVKPLITEKAATMSTENKYIFEVAIDANKIQIVDAIQEVYGVKPLAINIVSVKGKNVRYGKTKGKRKDWKKAIITLTKGQTINIYEGV